MKEIAANAASRIKHLFDLILIYCKAFYKRYGTKGRIAGSGIVIAALAVIVLIAVSTGNTGDGGIAGNDNPAESTANIDAGPAADDGAVTYTADGYACMKDVYAIVADGKDIVYMASEEDAQTALSQITERYKDSGAEIISTGFMEDVTVEKRDFESPALVFPVEDAVNYIITGSAEPKTYVVKGGDNLWDIAIENGISPYDLQDMNPGLDPKKLAIGMEISLYKKQPFISVAFTEKVTNEERIAYNVVYENDDSMYKGQTKVKSVGTYGSKEVVSEITKENGVAVNSKVISETVLSEPVAQVALKGTLALPVYTGSSSGQLSSPVALINVTSPFGSRGGRLHSGVDLKDPEGTPIYAAADGVVTQANCSGTLGNVIKISHGGGLETWYGHCETLLVSVGDTVTRGQQIATMGMTGNATCYHVHFEVRVNGKPQNPMNYI